LINRVENGEIKIPKFQRPFVWKHKAVLQLLESLIKGYPMGSLLFWRTDQKLRSERDIEGFSLPSTPEKYPTNYVLDGQQRLTTIFGVLSYGGSAASPHILNVVYDLQEKEFRHVLGNEPKHCLPLSILFNFKHWNAFQKELVQLPNGAGLNEEAERLNETFREYMLPVVTITDRTLDEVCPMFERINSTGTKLTIYDLMVAATFETDFDLNDEVETLQESFEEEGFHLEGESIIRAVAATRDTAVSKSSLLALRSIGSSELKGSLKTARLSIEKAIDFLQTEVGVISSDFLPYDAQLLVLAKLFKSTKSFSAEQRKLVRSWFWASSFTERYRGASDSLLNEDLEHLPQRLAKGDPLLKQAVFTADDFRSREFRKSSAISNAFVALLASNSPLNLTNAAPIDVAGSLAWSNQREFHHLFPRAYLAGRTEDEKREQNNLLNIVLLASGDNKEISAKNPKVYLQEIRQKLGPRFSEVLASNLLPPFQDSGIQEEDYPYFLEARAEHVAAHVNGLCGFSTQVVGKQAK
jgi:hypothetical protein